MAVTQRTRRYANTGPTRDRAYAETVLAILVVVALVIIAIASGTRPPATSVTRTVSVSDGETLWALASANPVDGMSTSQTVELIVQMNALNGSEVAVGQRIMLPAASDTAALAMR
jgi:hypothetical protein